jgi:hypothetical protein
LTHTGLLMEGPRDSSTTFFCRLMYFFSKLVSANDFS